jgi:hypothetical protein
MLVTQQRYRVSGGWLTVSLKTDHPLSRREREAFDRIAASCNDCADTLGRNGRDDPFDEALTLLGGEENICAG